MKDQSRDYTWKGLIWGAVLYVLFVVAPAIIILRYFFTIDYVLLIFGLIAMLICFVLQRKKHGALGERVRKRIFEVQKSSIITKSWIKMPSWLKIYRMKMYRMI